MGVSLASLVEGKTIDLQALSGRVIAIDTFNFLYQFLATIRGPDGAPLTNAQGDVTSHLVGLFSRTIRLVQAGIKPVFIIDGEAPDLKKKERQRRSQLKEEAQKEFEVAKERRDFEAMKKFASRTSKLTRPMVDDAIEVISAMGLPHVLAPSEGEAQAAFMACQEDVDAIASQDFDSLLFGAPVIIRNLSITGKRRHTKQMGYTTIMPEEITLSEVLNSLGIDQDQLIVLGILTGTDFNYGGIKGIGPKKSLKLLKKHGKDFDAVFSEVEWQKYWNVDWREIMQLFQEMPVTREYSLQWAVPDTDQLRELLIGKHGFEENRVTGPLKKLEQMRQEGQQKGLGDFF
ncbi:MAG: flap endonuclease-1 [Nanoarchaeota archaeon]